MDGLTSTPNIAFTEGEIVNIEDADRVGATATATSHKRRDIAMEYIVGRLSQASGISRASWRTQTLSV
jgi:putative Mg2+ transporter-C (MgtC) family protein